MKGKALQEQISQTERDIEALINAKAENEQQIAHHETYLKKATKNFYEAVYDALARRMFKKSPGVA